MSSHSPDDADPHDPNAYRDYELTVRQQPKQARMCGVSGKDRRPIDPPPIIELRVRERRRDPSLPLPSDDRDSVSFLENPYFFMFASLASVDSDTEMHLLSDGQTRCTTGQVVSSLYHLKDTENRNSDAGFFVFPDLSVRTEGSYRLKLSLFEIVGMEVVHCKSIFSKPFYVYTAKKFPGMEESTPLSCSLADQGIKIRIRKDIRVRKKGQQRDRYDSSSSDVGGGNDAHAHAHAHASSAPTGPRQVVGRTSTSPSSSRKHAHPSSGSARGQPPAKRAKPESSPRRGRGGSNDTVTPLTASTSTSNSASLPGSGGAGAGAYGGVTYQRAPEPGSSAGMGGATGMGISLPTWATAGGGGGGMQGYQDPRTAGGGYPISPTHTISSQQSQGQQGQQGQQGYRFPQQQQGYGADVAYPSMGREGQYAYPTAAGGQQVGNAEYVQQQQQQQVRTPPSAGSGGFADSRYLLHPTPAGAAGGGYGNAGYAGQQYSNGGRQATYPTTTATSGGQPALSRTTSYAQPPQATQQQQQQYMPASSSSSRSGSISYAASAQYAPPPTTSPTTSFPHQQQQQQQQEYYTHTPSTPSTGPLQQRPTIQTQFSASSAPTGSAGTGYDPSPAGLAFPRSYSQQGSETATNSSSTPVSASTTGATGPGAGTGSGAGYYPSPAASYAALSVSERGGISPSTDRRDATISSSSASGISSGNGASMSQPAGGAAPAGYYTGPGLPSSTAAGHHQQQQQPQGLTASSASSGAGHDHRFTMHVHHSHSHSASVMGVSGVGVGGVGVQSALVGGGMRYGTHMGH